MLHLSTGTSHSVAQHDILFGKLQQHRVIEELVNAYVFTQTLFWKKNRQYYCGVSTYVFEKYLQF